MIHTDLNEFQNQKFQLKKKKAVEYVKYNPISMKFINMRN